MQKRIAERIKNQFCNHLVRSVVEKNEENLVQKAQNIATLPLASPNAQDEMNPLPILNQLQSETNPN